MRPWRRRRLRRRHRRHGYRRLESMSDWDLDLGLDDCDDCQSRDLNLPFVRATDSEFRMHLEEAATMETTCRFPECERSLSDFDINCNVCDGRYCSDHVLPEQHGCDEIIEWERLLKEGKVKPRVVRMPRYDADDSDDSIYDRDSDSNLSEGGEHYVWYEEIIEFDKPEPEPEPESEQSSESDEDSDTSQESAPDWWDELQYVPSGEVQSVLSEEVQSVPSEEVQSVASEEVQSVASEEVQSVASEELQSVLYEVDQSVLWKEFSFSSSEESQSVLSEKEQSLASEQEQSILSEAEQSVGSVEKPKTVDNKTRNTRKQLNLKKKPKSKSAKVKK